MNRRAQRREQVNRGERCSTRSVRARFSTWRLADLGAKRPMLIAGLGWGSMPNHLVTDELARGQLKRIGPAGFDEMTARLVFSTAYSGERTLGPAAAWMINYLRSVRVAG